MTEKYEILGVKDDELVLLEYEGDLNDLENIKYHGLSMRLITQDQIEERKSPNYAENERDLWVEAVRGGYTDDGLEDWWEDLCDQAEMEGLLYPYDDDSSRADTEEAYENLSDKDREVIEEVLGVKGEDYETYEWGCYGTSPLIEGEWQAVIRQDIIDFIMEKEAKKKVA